MNRTTWSVVAVIVLALAAAFGGYYWWQQHQAAPTASLEEPAPPASQAAAPPAAPASAASTAQIQHPVEPPPGLPPLPPAGESEAYVQQRLVELLGRPSVLKLLNTDHFVAHFVATIDNLPRDTASSRVWPVNPTADRFIVEQSGGQTVWSPKNARRYTPLVTLAEKMDTGSAVALYKHLYPLFQHEYEELGYPGRYFNDRLVEVIDHLLAAPEPTPPVALKLTEVKGPIASTRPWVRYEYADPDLESRSAGQKVLMRLGPAQERQMKAKLRELRAQIVQAHAEAR